MKLGYTIIYVTDPVQTVEFWERAFAVVAKPGQEHPQYRELETGSHTLAFAAADFVRETIAFRAPDKAGPPAPFEVGLVTDDVAGAVERALTAGAVLVLSPTVKPWGQTVAYVRDCDGTLVELCTPMA